MCARRFQCVTPDSTKAINRETKLFHRAKKEVRQRVRLSIPHPPLIDNKRTHLDEVGSFSFPGLAGQGWRGHLHASEARWSNFFSDLRDLLVQKLFDRLVFIFDEGLLGQTDF